jgi:hypothetical protein
MTYWAILFLIYQSCSNFWATFFNGKMDWATFWAILSQTHLVTQNLGIAYSIPHLLVLVAY